MYESIRHQSYVIFRDDLKKKHYCTDHTLTGRISMISCGHRLFRLHKAVPDSTYNFKHVYYSYIHFQTLYMILKEFYVPANISSDGLQCFWTIVM